MGFILDVLEHNMLKRFLKNICKSLKSNGSLIIGMPSEIKNMHLRTNLDILIVSQKKS